MLIVILFVMKVKVSKNKKLGRASSMMGWGEHTSRGEHGNRNGRHDMDMTDSNRKQGVTYMQKNMETEI